MLRRGGTQQDEQMTSNALAEMTNPHTVSINLNATTLNMLD